MQTGIRVGRELERQKNINTRPEPNYVVAPPNVCETTASSLDISTPEILERKRKYDSEILPQQLYENAFVHVETYFDFVSGCAQAINSNQVPSTQAIQCFAGDDFFECSLALCRAFGKEIIRHVSDVDVQHQVPISPNEGKEQDVDIAFFWQPKSASAPRVYALLEYKPYSEFSSYESQASVYGTDLMTIDNRPTIVMQAHGTKLESMNFRVFGIAPARLTTDTANELQENTARHRKALLYEGYGHRAFAGIVNGLAECAKTFRHLAKQSPTDFNIQSTIDFNIRGKISSTASVREIRKSTGLPQPVFFKSYDYRLRENTPKNDRRHVNLELIHEFIDRDAKHFCLGKHLEVVVMQFFEQEKGKNEWHSDFPARNLASILRDLEKLYREKGYVHGDVRLFNMLLHVGKLVDFDHA